MKDTLKYHNAVQKLREFFAARGFIEIPVQSRLSIMAACEDPETVSTFTFAGETWPLPQTGQMWLEMELLNHPDWHGVYCVSTSYRNEPNPIPGRHDLIFPMFEFEAKGDLEDLIELETELLGHLELGVPVIENYDDVCKRYGTDSVEVDEEEALTRDLGGPVVITKFPFRSHPFWNMKEVENRIFNKVDVIIAGMETIGSAERSCNSEQMENNFYGVSNGKYADKLFDLFGKDRVLKELAEYLSHPMFPRFGGGIGLTRMSRALAQEGGKK